MNIKVNIDHVIEVLSNIIMCRFSLLSPDEQIESIEKLIEELRKRQNKIDD